MKSVAEWKCICDAWLPPTVFFMFFSTKNALHEIAILVYTADTCHSDTVTMAIPGELQWIIIGWSWTSAAALVVTREMQITLPACIQ